jgi:hypothetical protein
MPSENAVVTFNITHNQYTNRPSPVQVRGRTKERLENNTTHRARFLSPIGNTESLSKKVVKSRTPDR